MEKEQTKEFEKLWKVKLLKSLRKLEDLRGTITRTEQNSIARDLSMIKYGFEAGLKIKEKTDSEEGNE